jgi:hypothetical protein
MFSRMGNRSPVTEGSQETGFPEFEILKISKLSKKGRKRQKHKEREIETENR